MGPERLGAAIALVRSMTEARTTNLDTADIRPLHGWRRTALVTALAALTLLLMSVPVLPVR